MKTITFEIDDDGSVTGRTQDRLTDSDRVAIAHHLIEHMDIRQKR